MPDTHDERGGDAQQYSAIDLDSWWSDAPMTDRQLDVLQSEIDNRLIPEGAHFHKQVVRKLAGEVKQLREQLAAATARAEKAEAGVDRWLCYASELENRLGNERQRAEKAEARLAERQPIRAEWSTENACYRPGDDVISQELAVHRVAKYPTIHTAVLRRQLYAGPWVPAADACRSCGETEGVRGDPPRCPNCAVYAPASFTGLLAAPSVAADAAQDGLSATETSGDGAECPNPNIDGICRHLTCGRCKQHTGDSHQGHYWAWCKVTNTKREFHFCCPGDCELEHDDTTEAGGE